MITSMVELGSVEVRPFPKMATVMRAVQVDGVAVGEHLEYGIFVSTCSKKVLLKDTGPTFRRIVARGLVLLGLAAEAVLR